MLSIDLNNRRAIVTGVTSGIGAAIANKLAEAGCNVAGCGSSIADSAGAKGFIESVESHGREALYFQVDLATREGPAAFVSSVVKKWDTLDILISNAGRNVFKGAEDCYHCLTRRLSPL